jgi:hypothetical protein
MSLEHFEPSSKKGAAVLGSDRARGVGALRDRHPGRAGIAEGHHQTVGHAAAMICHRVSLAELSLDINRLSRLRALWSACGKRGEPR